MEADSLPCTSPCETSDELGSIVIKLLPSPASHWFRGALGAQLLSSVELILPRGCMRDVSSCTEPDRLDEPWFALVELWRGPLVPCGIAARVELPRHGYCEPRR